MKISESFASLKRIFQHTEQFGVLEGLKLFKNKHAKLESSVEYNLKGFKNSIILRAGTSDTNTFYHIFLDGQYDFPLLTDPEVIVDCGANIGLSALYFANKFPAARIIAIEPERENFEMLCHNTRNYDNITCLHNGIWNKRSFLKIEDIGLGKWGFIVREVSEPSGETISALAISDLMDTYKLEKIGLLKMDIEGSEKEVFEHDSSSWLNVTDAIVIETHDYMKKGSTKAFFKALEPYDYKTSVSGENFLVEINHR